MEHTTRTVKQWADISGVKPDSARTRATRILGRTVGQTTLLTAAEWRTVYPDSGVQQSGISGQLPQSVPNKKKGDGAASPAARRDPVAKVQPVAPIQPQESNARRWILYLLMAIPALASIQNIQGVTNDITGHLFGSVLLTGLFSASPFLFVLAGVKNAPTRILVACMVTYEAFCNLTRIYGGLTGFGKGGFPTRFLGLVTDIFNSGTHETGVFLAFIMAILAACTFYAAYFELTKK